ncbi:hypothetical protein DFH09DRAFT_1275644 [Mycena vulgaris]|nr:hypothetical protein DFH09DRAFT_1275644 [Mycena vulgaris]
MPRPVGSDGQRKAAAEAHRESCRESCILEARDLVNEPSGVFTWFHGLSSFSALKTGGRRQDVAQDHVGGGENPIVWSYFASPLLYYIGYLRRREPREDIWSPGSCSFRLNNSVLIRTKESRPPSAVSGRHGVHSNGISGRNGVVVLDTVRASTPNSTVNCAIQVHVTDGESRGEVHGQMSWWRLWPTGCTIPIELPSCSSPFLYAATLMCLRVSAPTPRFPLRAGDQARRAVDQTGELASIISGEDGISSEGLGCYVGSGSAFEGTSRRWTTASHRSFPSSVNRPHHALPVAIRTQHVPTVGDGEQIPPTIRLSQDTIQWGSSNCLVGWFNTIWTLAGLFLEKMQRSTFATQAFRCPRRFAFIRYVKLTASLTQTLGAFCWVDAGPTTDVTLLLKKDLQAMSFNREESYRIRTVSTEAAAKPGACFSIVENPSHQPRSGRHSSVPGQADEGCSYGSEVERCKKFIRNDWLQSTTTVESFDTHISHKAQNLMSDTQTPTTTGDGGVVVKPGIGPCDACKCKAYKGDTKSSSGCDTCGHAYDKHRDE